MLTPFRLTPHWIRGRVVCLPPLGWGSWFMFALHWAGKVVYGYFPLGDLVSGLLPTGGEGGLHDYPCWGRGWVFWLLPAGEVGLMVTSHWGSWFNGCFLLGKLVSGLLPAGGEGGLYDYSPLGERVGFWVTSC